MKTSLLAAVVSLATMTIAAPLTEGAEFNSVELATRLQVGYAVRLIDMNSDGLLDICVVDAKRILWLENPTWQEHIIHEDRQRTDNVCFAPLDINRNGKIDFAIGADWTVNTSAGGTIEWLKQPFDQGSNRGTAWERLAISTEPTVHRMQFIDIDNDSQMELVVLPLMGRETTRPHFAEAGVRILAFEIPANPSVDPWPMQVLYDKLHVTHNFIATDLNNDGQVELMVVSFEGITLLERPENTTNQPWNATLIGIGDQESSPNRGASEIKLGKLASGQNYIATIEPWHGNQVAVYTPPKDQNQTLWDRKVIDNRLKWGHAIACADLDGDADDELIVGVRDDLDENHRRGLRIYDPVGSTPPNDIEIEWRPSVIEPGAVAIEDLATGDLNQDGLIDIVTVGRQTNNIKIYYNTSK